MKFSTRDLCFCAIGAALIAVCAWISIPADVPFTLQTFAIFTVCGLLGRQARHGERAGVSAAGRGRRAGVRGLSRRVRVPARHDGRLPRRLCAADAHHHLRAGALGAGPVGVRALGGRGAARVLCVRNGVVSHRLHPHGAITLGVVLAKCVLPFLLPDAVKLALATLLRARLYRRIPA